MSYRCSLAGLYEAPAAPEKLNLEVTASCKQISLYELLTIKAPPCKCLVAHSGEGELIVQSSNLKNKCDALKFDICS